MVLVDTSVWIHVLRRGAKQRLEDLLDIDDVVIALPIVQALLQGFAEPSALRAASESLLALPIVDSPMPQARYLEAAALYRLSRRAGITIRSSVDCLIAACAIQHDLTVMHHDRDFDALAKISPLRTRRM